MNWVKIENGSWINFDNIVEIGIILGCKYFHIILSLNPDKYTWKSGFKTKKDAQKCLDNKMEKLMGYDFVTKK